MASEVEAPRQLDPLALAQLAAWEDIARDHPLLITKREPGHHLACAQCGMTILPSDDSRNPYWLTPGVILAATVAHLRNVHRDLDPDRGNSG